MIVHNYPINYLYIYVYICLQKKKILNKSEKNCIYLFAYLFIYLFVYLLIYIKLYQYEIFKKIGLSLE